MNTWHICCQVSNREINLSLDELFYKTVCVKPQTFHMVIRDLRNNLGLQRRQHIYKAPRGLKSFFVNFTLCGANKNLEVWKKGNSQSYFHCEDAFHNIFLIFEMQRDGANNRRKRRSSCLGRRWKALFNTHRPCLEISYSVIPALCTCSLCLVWNQQIFYKPSLGVHSRILCRYFRSRVDESHCLQIQVI